MVNYNKKSLQKIRKSVLVTEGLSTNMHNQKVYNTKGAGDEYEFDDWNPTYVTEVSEIWDVEEETLKYGMSNLGGIFTTAQGAGYNYANREKIKQNITIVGTNVIYEDKEFNKVGFGVIYFEAKITQQTLTIELKHEFIEDMEDYNDKITMVSNSIVSLIVYTYKTQLNEHYIPALPVIPLKDEDGKIIEYKVYEIIEKHSYNTINSSPTLFKYAYSFNYDYGIDELELNKIKFSPMPIRISGLEITIPSIEYSLTSAKHSNILYAKIELKSNGLAYEIKAISFNNDEEEENIPISYKNFIYFALYEVSMYRVDEVSYLQDINITRPIWNNGIKEY